MKRAKRILIGVCCVALLAVSWVIAITAKSDAEKQAELIDQAAAYTADEIYVLAVPLLEEAVEFNTDCTLEAENALKDVYKHLLNQRGYSRKYTSLLDMQMSREDALPEYFEEAAQFYLGRSKLADALTVLRNGVEKTGDTHLTDLYEENRYKYSMGLDYYFDVTSIANGAIQVQIDGKWGIASATGSLVIPCEYDRISTFSNGKAIVQKDNVISAVEENNNRVALLHESASEFGNYAADRTCLRIVNGWVISSGNFTMGQQTFEEFGMYSNGYAPVKQNGKWGLINTSGSEWLVEPQHDDIIRDELGRAYSQGVYFASKGGQIYLYTTEGEQAGGPYEDAKPFADGWAAVMKNGKWGFIDTAGSVQIDFQFGNALSFGQHLAAVEVDGQWGYVSKYGKIVIDPIFLSAKSFYNGSAPVQTVDGWRFITLTEYKGGANLL